MANCNNLFIEFNKELSIPEGKRQKLIKSKNHLRERIRQHFRENHPNYIPQFYIQGSYKMGTIIRTQDNTCDLDDGVYFLSNPEGLTGKTLQKWVHDAVSGVTNTPARHRRKCITVDYVNDYNIDLPVYWYDKAINHHPFIAVKNDDWKEDDPREFIDYFNRMKDRNGQLVRMVKYLKAWCDNSTEKVPSGLSMTVLALKHFQPNDRDDVAFKFLLAEIERNLRKPYKCLMPTTPFDNLFDKLDDNQLDNFKALLLDFIADAKNAVDVERNQQKASLLWQKHFGNKYFPEGTDIDEERKSTNLSSVIGNAKPYHK
jgi:hypothetical protein